MSLQKGTLLGPYRIHALIGVGGMGEVYRARDTTLGREVAIKVLPTRLTEDRDRLARFEREAQLLASLNHPNIATLYGFFADRAADEGEGKIPFLVMELVEGQDLAERRHLGPLPFEEVVPIFRQIAEGLEAAHERGIVHRDLKPANIKVGDDGRVKILDFGVAKAVRTPDASETTSPDDPTRTYHRDPAQTREGQVLGTVAYMSPEQASGKPVDRRTDVWSFGVCLYEAIAGSKAFPSSDPSETLAAVLRDDVDLAALPPSTPPQIYRLLRRCLIRDPAHRLRSLGDACLELDDALARGAASEVTGPAPAPSREQGVGSMRPHGGRLAVAILGALALGVMAGTLLSRAGNQSRESSPIDPRRLTIHLPESLPIERSRNEQGTRNLVISPDGSVLVYVSESPRGNVLVQRRLDDFEARVLPGTEGAYEPFFSPDGQWVGYFRLGELLKIRVDGGSPQPLYEGNFLIKFGGCWGEDGFLYFVDVQLQGTWLLGRLLRIPEDGGSVETVLELGPEVERGSPVWPAPLPGGRGLLFGVRTESWTGWLGDTEKVRVESFDLESGARRVLAEHATMPRFVHTGPQLSGYVVYSQDRRLMARPFDADRLEATGPPVEITQPSMSGPPGLGAAAPRRWDLSADGELLVYAQGSERSVLVFADRAGTKDVRESAPSPEWALSVSPTGRQIAFGATDGDIWIYDHTIDSATRLTTHQANDWQPIWSRDGQEIVFSSGRGGGIDLYTKRADGVGAAELLYSSKLNLYADSLTKDSSELIYNVWGDPETLWDLGRLTLDREPVEAEPLVRTEFYEAYGQLSPDGRWLAYSSTESGGWQIYVQPYPAMDERRKVSIEEGLKPRWSRTGEEIVFLASGGVMTVRFDPERGSNQSVPVRLLEGDYTSVDVLPDGRMVVSELVHRRDHELLVVSQLFEDLASRRSSSTR